MGECRYRRVMLKLSGEAVQGDAAYGIDAHTVSYVADQIAALASQGVEVGVVIGGGNIWRGEQASRNGMERATADYMGMLATVLNALALQAALERKDVQTRVQTAINMAEVAEPYIRRRAIRHLEKGRVVIFASGTGNPFFTTDTAAALRALEIGADAKFIPNLTHREAIEKKLAVMDSTALALCMDNQLPIYVFNMDDEENIDRIVSGERVGTVVTS